MLEETIERATQRDPEQRFPSATDMRAALAAALAEPERRRLRRRRVGYAVLGVLGCAILGGASYGATQPELRARAYSTIKPTLEQLDRLRHRGQPTALVQAEPAARPATPAALAPASRPTVEAEAEPASAEPEAQTDQMDDDGETEEAAGPTEPKVEQAKSEQASSEQAKPASDEKLESALAAAQELLNGGQRLKGYGQIKQLGKRYGQDPRVLKAWCEAAVATRSWGEAYRVANRWVAADKSSESLLELARRERSLGRVSDAVKTVNRVLKDDPQSAEATKLLETLTKAPSRVAQK